MDFFFHKGFFWILDRSNIVWSNCTIYRITTNLQSSKRYCLRDVPEYDSEYGRCGNKIVDEGMFIISLKKNM